MTEHGEQGERGRTGQTGAAGAAGEAGTAGAAGDVGARGEAGVPGRQGEAGVSGRQGEAGTAGLAGTAGARGRAGRAWSGRQSLVVFVVVVAAGGLSTLRAERNSHRIEENARSQCVQVAVVARQINSLADALVRAEARRPDPDVRLPAELAELKTPVVGCD